MGLENITVCYCQHFLTGLRFSVKKCFFRDDTAIVGCILLLVYVCMGMTGYIVGKARLGQA